MYFVVLIALVISIVIQIYRLVNSYFLKSKQEKTVQIFELEVDDRKDSKCERAKEYNQRIF